MGDEGQYTTSRIQNYLHPVRGEGWSWEPLVRRIGDARFVLLGEATHGTHEFYAARAEITRRLIQEKGFTAVAVEADWPDAYRVNRFVQGRDNDASAREALGDFSRFPAWMWRNIVVEEFASWLRSYNDELTDTTRRAGFYGLDLYSMQASAEAVVRYLDDVDPEAARRARFRFARFEHFGEDPADDGYAAGFDLEKSCEDEVVAQLIDLRIKTFDYLRQDGYLAEDEQLYTGQNARAARNGEAYYHAMFRGNVDFRNLRDGHMMQTLEALTAHLERHGQPAKVVVWAHNTRLGDTRATGMARRGERNLGALVCQRWGDEAVHVGFTTYSGTVTVASTWGLPSERMQLRPALPGSIEWLFHALETSAFLLLLDSSHDALADLNREMLQRAIGAVYRPETERLSHYFTARLMEQFNAVIHFDETRALEPLEEAAGWEPREAPETFPTGV